MYRSNNTYGVINNWNENGPPQYRSPKTHLNMCLDLDETLINTFSDIPLYDQIQSSNDKSLNEVKSRLYSFNYPTSRKKHEYQKYVGIMRPGLREFLEFCLENFAVLAVWTAGTLEYGHAICEIIFEGLHHPDIIYTREDCEDILGHKGGSYNQKPLEKMIFQEEWRGPSTRFLYSSRLEVPESDDLGMNLTNTLVLDDRFSTFVGPNPYNGIVIPDFQPTLTMDGLKEYDPSLYELKHWLSKPEVMKCKDVRCLNKNHIFSKRARLIDDEEEMLIQNILKTIDFESPEMCRNQKEFVKNFEDESVELDLEDNFLPNESIGRSYLMKNHTYKNTNKSPALRYNNEFYHKNKPLSKKPSKSLYKI